MGYIYKITNKVNGKVYVGQTNRDIPTRWAEHLYYSHNPNRGYNSILHSAIRKYGDDSFYVEEIEECSTDQLEERERYWIKAYGSAVSGYNSSLGGKGWVKCSDEEILYWWNTGRSMTEIAEYLPMHPETISKHLQRLGVTQQEILDRGNLIANRKKMKPVYQYDSDGNFIKEFPSLRDAQESIGGKRIKLTPKARERRTAGYQWRHYKADKIEPYRDRRNKEKVS